MSQKTGGDNLHKGHRDRLKKKYMLYGLDSLAEHEVLELLLYYCIAQRDTNELAHRMINEYGKLYRLFESSPIEISKRCGVSENTAVLVSMAAPLAKLYTKSKWSQDNRLNSSRKCGEFAKTLFTGEITECFYLICLDNQRRLIHPELLIRGTVDEAQIYPREVIRVAVKHNASSVVLAHNHPSGLLGVSSKDIEATKRIIRVLSVVDVEVVDHIVVAGEDYLSFVEKRILGMRPDMDGKAEI